MRFLFGTLLPFVGRVIGPCDAEGNPAMNDEEERTAHFEIKAWCFAWFGQVMMVPFGDVAPRAVDPDNPRQYLAVNL